MRTPHSAWRSFGCQAHADLPSDSAQLRSEPDSRLSRFHAGPTNARSERSAESPSVCYQTFRDFSWKLRPDEGKAVATMGIIPSVEPLHGSVFAFVRRVPDDDDFHFAPLHLLLLFSPLADDRTDEHHVAAAKACPAVVDRLFELPHTRVSEHSADPIDDLPPKLRRFRFATRHPTGNRQSHAPSPRRLKSVPHSIFKTILDGLTNRAGDVPVVIRPIGIRNYVGLEDVPLMDGRVADLVPCERAREPLELPPHLAKLDRIHLEEMPTMEGQKLLHVRLDIVPRERHYLGTIYFGPQDLLSPERRRPSDPGLLRVPRVAAITGDSHLDCSLVLLYFDITPYELLS